MNSKQPAESADSHLASHRRERPPFAKLFERTHEQTIAGMDQGGADIANQAPRNPLRLKRVGVKRRAIPVLISDPFGSGKIVQLSCCIEAGVGLGAERRGIHVSRIGDLLAALSGRAFASLGQYAAQMNELLRSTQDSSFAFVSINGEFTYLENVGGSKEKASLEHLELSAGADCENGLLSSSIGLAFQHVTACPCVQETYRHSFLPEKPIVHPAREGQQIPLLTHSQRCRTRLTISGARDTPPLAELLSCIDGILVRCQNTLPRELELSNVYRAHVRSQFIEDALRDLLVGIYRLARPRSTSGTIAIASTSMESIHDFDLKADIEFSFGELDAILGPR
jgi:GTP cyclohydrolase FolE2